MVAYCWQTGVIGFGPRVPKGAILIMGGSGQKFKAEITVMARHAYDGITLLVPGIPEADGEEAKLDALDKFIDWYFQRQLKKFCTAIKKVAA